MQLFDPCDVTIVELSTYRAPQFRSCEYIALFFEAVRKSADLADGLIRFFEEIKGVLLSGRYNSPCGSRSGEKWRLLGPKAIFMKKPRARRGRGTHFRTDTFCCSRSGAALVRCFGEVFRSRAPRDAVQICKMILAMVLTSALKAALSCR